MKSTLERASNNCSYKHNPIPLLCKNQQIATDTSKTITSRTKTQTCRNVHILIVLKAFQSLAEFLEDGESNNAMTREDCTHFVRNLHKFIAYCIEFKLKSSICSEIINDRLIILGSSKILLVPYLTI